MFRVRGVGGRECPAHVDTSICWYKHRKVGDEVGVGAEEAGDVRDEVGVQLVCMVLLQHGYKLLVGVRGGMKALLDLDEEFEIGRAHV